jgi:hypothetical protein
VNAAFAAILAADVVGYSRMIGADNGVTSRPVRRIVLRPERRE